MGQASPKYLDDEINQRLAELISDTQFLKAVPDNPNVINILKLMNAHSRFKENLESLKSVVINYQKCHYTDIQSYIELTNAVNDANRTLHAFKERFCCG